MMLRWKTARLCLTVIFLFLAGTSRAYSGQTSLPFQLSVWEKKLEAFPCQDCHADIPVEIGQEGTESEEHNNISLQHGGLRCLDCHNAKDHNLLQTIDHRLVRFSDMEVMCGGCHAAVYRDWEKGIHGKLLGSWSGAQWGLRCVECHDAHRPKPMAIKPESPPYPPAAAPGWSVLP